MAEFTQVKADLWEDPEFEELSPAARLLWLNLLTTPTRNTAGLYHMSIRRMSFETGLEHKDITETLSTLETLGWIRWDADVSLVWVRNFVRRQPCGPSVVTKIMADIDGLGAHPFVDEFRAYYADILSTPTKQGTDTVSTPTRHGTDTIPIPSATRARGNGTVRDRNGTGTVRDGDGDISALVDLCRSEIQGWEPDEKDLRCVKRGLDRLGRAHAERIILELAAYQDEKPPKSRYRNPRLALDKWFAKEKAVPAGSRAHEPTAERMSAAYPDIVVPEDWQ